MSIEDLEKAVVNLPPDAYADFRAWFDAFEADRFDAKIERDAKVGKLDGLSNHALDEVASSFEANAPATFPNG